MGRGKVVFVDFGKGRRPSAQGFGLGRRGVLAVFLGLLFGEVLLAAALLPSSIASFFFAPTAIALAVAATLGLNRLAVRIRVGRLHARSARQTWSGDDPERTGRTLH